MEALGAVAARGTRVYFTGGATAVLHGWRGSTIDVDLVFVPEQDRVYRELARLKEGLELNIELASPAHFIPVPEGWEERGQFIAQRGNASFFHYDLEAQALAKIERGHAQDVTDVAEMLRRGLVEPARLRERFGQIEPLLYRFPAVDPAAFRLALDTALGGPASTGPR
jgi:hypothetical protein